SSLKYVDILIHVSAQDLQRNLDSYSRTGDGPLDTFAPGWRTAVDLRQSQAATRAAFIAYWSSKMEALDLPPAQRAELVSGTTRNQRLYWLVFVSRSDFAKGLCAVSGGKVLPALDAAHIRPYAEGGLHKKPNGILLRKDIHCVFDSGYATVDTS